MKTTIFYFSATGNSLYLAKRLALEVGECELLSIANLVNEENFEVDSPNIGFVFPVFAWGLPRIVAEFVKKLILKNQSYVFAVASCVAIPGKTLKELEKILQQKGIELDAGFVVKAGRSSLMKLNFLDKIIIALDKKRKYLIGGESRIGEIVTAIKGRKFQYPETSSISANLFGAMFHNLALKTFITKDGEFKISDTCKGCGQCARLCPRSNIIINNGRPEFLHNCEFCHACIQWCPEFAITHPDFDHSLPQYRNSQIKVQELYFAGV